jgi:NAD(P)H-hydrate epimerase
MGAVDRATIAAGIPGIVLMENAAHRVVEYMVRRFSPLRDHAITVVCGKGNNGGDGLAIARQLYTRFRPRALHVVLIEKGLKGDAAQNLAMLHACGFREQGAFPLASTLIVDAVLGTGLEGAASGAALDMIRAINKTPATVVAVDIPSGLSGSSGIPPGEYVRADGTVTFTAPKLCHVIPPASRLMGELVIAPIGTDPHLYEDDDTIRLGSITAQFIASLFAPRRPDANKGSYGHALVIAGSAGKPGAAAMAGMAALRAGAGLITVAAPESAIGAIAAMCPEIMTEPLQRVTELAATRTVTAIGPGIGTSDRICGLVLDLFENLDKPLIVDADALNCLAAKGTSGVSRFPRVLTPHPGEMSRLMQRSIGEIQSDRTGAARDLARKRNVCVVLKGEATVIAWPDGDAWINPTGTPAMATGGTGDILTGILAGLVAQFPGDLRRAVAGAVFLHGRAGELAARQLGEQPVIATDLLRHFPEGIRGITQVHDEL